MTVRECYQAAGGNYEEAIGLLRKEERVQKYLLMLLKDPSYQLLCDSLKDRNIEEAFRGAHTLKGVSRNLALMELYNAACVLSDVLRDRHTYGEDIEPAFKVFKLAYEKTISAIRCLPPIE